MRKDVAALSTGTDDSLLEDHQVEDLLLMDDNEANNHGGILAEEAGLGKTRTVLKNWQLDIARNSHTAAGHGPSIVIVPKFLVPHWQNEATKVLPLVTGVTWLNTVDDVHGFDVSASVLLIMSVGFLRAHEDLWGTILAWKVHRLYFDEAEVVGGENKSAKMVRAISTNQTICWLITATPCRARGRRDIDQKLFDEEIRDFPELLYMFHLTCPLRMRTKSQFVSAARVWNAVIRHPDADTKALLPAVNHRFEGLANSLTPLDTLNMNLVIGAAKLGQLSGDQDDAAELLQIMNMPTAPPTAVTFWKGKPPAAREGAGRRESNVSNAIDVAIDRSVCSTPNCDKPVLFKLSCPCCAPTRLMKSCIDCITEQAAGESKRVRCSDPCPGFTRTELVRVNPDHWPPLTACGAPTAPRAINARAEHPDSGKWLATTPKGQKLAQYLKDQPKRQVLIAATTKFDKEVIEKVCDHCGVHYGNCADNGPIANPVQRFKDGEVRVLIISKSITKGEDALKVAQTLIFFNEHHGEWCDPFDRKSIIRRLVRLGSPHKDTGVDVIRFYVPPLETGETRTEPPKSLRDVRLFSPAQPPQLAPEHEAELEPELEPEPEPEPEPEKPNPKRRKVTPEVPAEVPAIRAALVTEGLEKYYDDLIEEGWDRLAEFWLITDTDLLQLGMPPGHRGRFLRCFQSSGTI